MGVSTDPTLSGLKAKLQSNEEKYLYICVGNTTNFAGMTDVVNQGMDILEQVNQGIESRVKLDGSNAEFVRLIDSHIDGTNGYNIWSNGYCEQWGLWTYSGTSTYNLVFTKQFADTDYQMFFSIQAPGMTGAYYAPGIENNTPKTVDGCTIGWRNAGANCYVYWRACGLLAQGQY